MSENKKPAAPSGAEPEAEQDAKAATIPTLNHYEAPAFVQYTNIFTDSFAY